MSSAPGRSRDPLYERPALDWLWAAALVLVHGAIVWWTGRGDLLAWHGPERRATVYVSIAGSTGTLLAVVSVGLGIYLSAGGERMRWLRRHAGWRGTRVWLAVMVNLLATLVISIGALASDSSTTLTGTVAEGAEWMRWAVQLTVLAVVISFARMLLFFREILTVKASDENERVGKAQRGVGFGQ